MGNFIFMLDKAILLWIQGHLRHPVLTVFFRAVTSLGNAGLIWIAITAALLFMPKTRKVGQMAALALLLSFFFNNLFLKNVVARIRPYEVIGNLVLLIKPAVDYSFPSGHTASSFCAAVVLWRCGRFYRKTGDVRFAFPNAAGWAALFLAFLISFSRLYVGVHYPTDVLFGAVSGILIGLLVFGCCLTRIGGEKK